MDPLIRIILIINTDTFHLWIPTEIDIWMKPIGNRASFM